MFELLPPVTAVMLALFAALGGWRAWRQRHAVRVAPRRRRGGRPAPDSPPLVPAAVLRGADRTWVVFTTPQCRVCREVAAGLRRSEPDSQVTEIDATREPRLVEAFGVGRLPAVLLANRYGQVTARLVGRKEIEAFTEERQLPG